MSWNIRWIFNLFEYSFRQYSIEFNFYLGIQSEKHLYIKHNEEENILFRHNKEFSAFTLWSPQWTEKGLAEQLSGSKTGEHTLSPNDFSQAISEDHCQSSFQEDFKECNCLLNETNSKELEEFYSYKGNNRLHLTGVNAHRKDVVFKTLVRSIRRYLWFVFSKMYNIKLLGKFKKSKVFKEFVCDFYQKNIKWNSKTALTLSSDEEEGVCFYIGTMMTKDHLFPDDSNFFKL